jgi:ADP-heptose:LPS heptosyltransferase
VNLPGESRIASAHSPMRGRYLVRNPGWNLWLRAADFSLGMFARRDVPTDAVPRRILIAIGGHLGDAVIATSLLPLMRRAWPNAEIGAVLGSWSARAIEGHPAIRWIHTVDHWRLERGDATLARKVQRWRATRETAVREMRAVGYDVAVDLSAYYPNMAGVLYGASIPVRLGWMSGGYGPLYTIAAEWTSGPLHTAEQHVELLRRLSPDAMLHQRVQTHELSYDLPPIPSSTTDSVTGLLASRGFAQQGYVVAHMGAGNARKEWEIQRWSAVISALAADGIPVVLTGAGLAERERARAVARKVPGVLDLTDELDWNGFRGVIVRARVVLSTDTVAAHVAAAQNVPTVVIATGMNDARHWRPLGQRVTMLMKSVPCAPCFQSRGCESMACIRGVSERSVLRATHGWLSA